VHVADERRAIVIATAIDGKVSGLESSTKGRA